MFGALVLLASCGGMDPELLQRSAPGFEPVLWFQGQHQGQVLVMDRNGNVHMSGSIQRDCGARSDSQSGVCQDQIQLWHYPDNNAFEPTRKLEQEVSWKYYHPTDHTTVFDFRDRRGSMQLSLRGRALRGSAERRIPGESEGGLSCAIHLERLAGLPERMLQRENCSALGIQRGQVQILWQKVAN